jgi:putative hydrolase of the HAD superfamily
MNTAAKPAPRNFASVETWVFDLDNTLYPHDLNLWQQIDDRIRAFVSDFLGVTKDDAFKLQKDYYKRYGTTMRGLMAEHNMKPDDFLEFVHKIDHSPLLPNPELGNALEKLPGRKLILTNGTRKHAENVMKRLEIDHHFEDVFDIAAADLDPHALGMTTVLVVPPATKEVIREGWEMEGREAPHVDHVTDDLTGFLQAKCLIR